MQTQTVHTDKITFIAQYTGGEDEIKEFECAHVVIEARAGITTTTGDGKTYAVAGGGRLRAMIGSSSITPDIDASVVKFTDSEGREHSYHGRLDGVGDVFKFAGV